MEASGKVKRSFRAKLMMSFYRTPKSKKNYYNNKVEKITTPPVNFPTPPPPPPPSQPKMTKKTNVVSYGTGRDFTEEDNVDRMATCYILRVQEGFRREQDDYGNWR